MNAMWLSEFSRLNRQSQMFEIHAHKIFRNSCHFLSYLNKYTLLISTKKFVSHSEYVLPGVGKSEQNDKTFELSLSQSHENLADFTESFLCVYVY